MPKLWRRIVQQFDSFAKIDWVVYIGAVFAAALACVAVLSDIVPMHDTLTLTATGTHNKEALTPEVVLIGIYADNKTVEIKPTSGKWYWRGYAYVWKSPSDPNQPAGLTADVSFKIPVGQNRSVKFFGHRWSGDVMVALTNSGEPQIVDTYTDSDSGAEFVWALPDSSGGRIVAATALMYTIALAIFFTALFLLIFAYQAIKRHWARLMAHWAVFVIGGVALAAFAMMRYAIKNNLETIIWFDTYYSLGFARNHSLWDAILVGINADGNGPLSKLVLFFWYRVTGYGIANLVIPSEVYTALTIVFVGLTAKKLFGGLQGVCGAIVAMNFMYFIQFGQSIRAYSLVVCLAAVMAYLYVGMMLDEERPFRRSLLFSVAMAAIVYTQVLTVLYCFGFFALDCAKGLRGKTVRRFWPYVLAAALYLPFLILFILNEPLTPSGEQFWTKYNLFTMLNALTLNKTLTFCFIGGICWLAFEFSKRRFAPDKTSADSSALFTLGITAVLTIALMFFIQSMFWTFIGGFPIKEDYLMFTIPTLMLVVGYFVMKLLEALAQVSPEHTRSRLRVFLLLALFLCSAFQTKEMLRWQPVPLLFNSTNNTMNEGWIIGKWAEVIRGIDAYADDTYIYTNLWIDRIEDQVHSNKLQPTDEWIAYDIGEDGKRDIPNISYRFDEVISNGGIRQLFTVTTEAYALSDQQYAELSRKFDLASAETNDEGICVRHWIWKEGA